MEIRGRQQRAKIQPPMAPMIDVVFQLLIFFMLTLKIVEPEGDFNVNMPIGQAPAPQSDSMSAIRVKLRAAPDGRLAALQLGNRNLGNDEAAFERLNGEILKIVGPPGNPLTKDIEVEIDADYNLNFEHVIGAVSACTGRMDPKNKRLVRYIEKIKFAPPKRPAAEA